MKYILIFLGLCLFTFAQSVTLERFNELKTVKENKIKINEFKEYSSIYLLKGVKETKRGQKPILFYITKDLKYVFFGKGFESATNEVLSIPNDMSRYKEFANFTYGEGSDEYYLFTDPQCPYCKKFEQMLSTLDSKKRIKIYYFLYPLAFHKEAVPMSNYILSKPKKERYKALTEVILENSKEYKSFSDQKSKELEKNMDIVFDVVVRGTPSLFDSKGKQLNYQKFIENLK